MAQTFALPKVDINIVDVGMELNVFDIQPSKHADAIHDNLAQVSAAYDRVKRERRFFVDKNLIASSNFSPVLLAKFSNLRMGSLEDSAEVDNVDAHEVFLREVHEQRDEQLLGLSIRSIWQLHEVANYYGIKITMLKQWFALWYAHQKETDDWEKKPIDKQVAFAQQLLYPAYWFYHPIAFGAATQCLIYNGTGHLGVMQPPQVNIPQSHLPGQILGPLNGCKGRLRNILQHALYDLIADLLCPEPKECCLRAFYFFHKILRKCKVWPMEFRFKDSSINDLRSRLDDFELVLHAKCSTCHKPYDALVENACSKVRINFEGLCLECMHDSRTQDPPTDHDYWERGRRLKNSFTNLTDVKA
ncbi:MAG: hypothetical protein Q9162_007895 [Coniocarpon cinnabarinum]